MELLSLSGSQFVFIPHVCGRRTRVIGIGARLLGAGSKLFLNELRGLGAGTRALGMGTNAFFIESRASGGGTNVIEAGTNPRGKAGSESGTVGSVCGNSTRGSGYDCHG